MSKLLIIDTYGLIFRAYHAYPMLTTADGTPTNAIYGFMQMLMVTFEKINPSHVAFSLESKTPTFRHVLEQTYKANRKPADEELKIQVAEILNILQALNIQTLYKDGYEADDVIGSFAVQNENSFQEIEIFYSFYHQK
jgi:DNA polymerase I